MKRYARHMALALGLVATVGMVQAQGEPVRVNQLPDALKELWTRTKPEMTDRSSCAAAFDPGDAQRMTLQCSVHIRMEAEGKRRSLRRCEEKREELGIRSPCRHVVE